MYVQEELPYLPIDLQTLIISKTDFTTCLNLNNREAAWRLLQRAGADRDATEQVVSRGNLIHFHTLRLMVSMGPSESLLAVEVAVRCGQFDILRSVLEEDRDLLLTDDDFNLRALVELAASNGDVSTVGLLFEVFDSHEDLESAREAALLKAAESNQPEVIKHILTISPRYALPTYLVVRVMCSTASSGYLECLKCLLQFHEIGALTSEYTRIFHTAAEGCQLQVLQYLHKRRRCPYWYTDDVGGSSHWDQAAQRGRLDVIQWAHKHYRDTISRRTLSTAIYHKQMTVARWLVKAQAFDWTDFHGVAISGSSCQKQISTV